MRGDVVLFKYTSGFYGWVIKQATGGPFVHVEIDLGDGRLMGAHSDGIVIYNGKPGTNTVSFHPPASNEDIEYGLRWAELQAGKQYGWSDIVSNGFKILGIPFDLGQPGHWDCSDFVTRYLTVARASGPLGNKAEDPGLVSPNDLARAYGILK